MQVSREQHLTGMPWMVAFITEGLLSSAHPQMAFLHDFGVGRHDLNPQNSPLFLRFKSDVRLELTQNRSSVDGH